MPKAFLLAVVLILAFELLNFHFDGYLYNAPFQSLNIKEYGEGLWHIDFSLKKPKDEFRIFILGGSSVYNLNYFDYLDYFEGKLENADDKKQMKIIPTAVDGADTNDLIFYLSEILNYEPDLIIIYSGHNEFLRVIDSKPFFNSTSLTRLNNKLIGTSSLYQLESRLIDSVRRLIFDYIIKPIKEKRKSFILFPCYDLPLFGINIEFNKSEIYEDYEKNIIKMVKFVKKNDVNIILSTVAYNRMFPPFEPPDEHYKYCEKLFTQHKYNEALDCFEKALDSDLLPVRATKTSNEIVENIAIEHNIPLADVDQKILESSKYMLGSEFFGDHNHLDYDGNKILIDVFYDTIIDNGLVT